MPPPTNAESHAHQPVAAAANSMPLPASAYNLHLNSIALASSSNLSLTSASYSALSNPISRSTTPASQSTRKPLYAGEEQQPIRPIYDASVPLSRTVYGGSSSLTAHTNNKVSHIANSAPHITSALNNYSASSQSTFLPASLPRTSSLLPPPRITVNEPSWKQPPLNDPFHASSWADQEDHRDHDDPVSPKNTHRRGSKTHSRSSSLGGLSDGFRNLNRWSISTASSRASNATPGAKSRFSRRMSIDSTSLFSQNFQQPTSPSRRLQKGRPSTAGASPEDSRPSIPPLATLPPILPLPSLEQEDFGRSAFPKQESRQLSRTESDASRFGNETPGVNETSFLSISARDRPDSVLPKSAFSRDATMAHPENGSPTFIRGHQRSRSQGLKSSTDSATSPRTRAKQPSQKAMLSKALQKANTAVQLDNAQNFEGARTAYYEACDLLQQVLDRTPGDDDKRKLEAIRKTYSSRIEELEQMLPEGDYDKALPQTPGSTSTGYRTRSTSVASTTDGSTQVTRQRSDTNRSQQSIPNYARPTSAAWRPQMSSNSSPKAAGFDGPRYVTPTPTNFSDTYDRSQSSFSQRSPPRGQNIDNDMFLARPMQDEYMPPPLSPRRPISPTRRPSEISIRADFSSNRTRLAPDVAASRGHQRANSHESISWLDPIDESGGSSVSSIHSRSSSTGVRRKHIRAPSGDTEAEFDAALDDAIEAAYDDGYEPAAPTDQTNGALDRGSDGEDVVAQALRKVQLAKERVRQSELEMERLATDRDRRMKALQEEEQTLPGGFYDGNDSDEEERILEEMTNGYAIEDFAFDEKSNIRLPRESDSSELTSRTWHSSTVSNPPTANTVLSTVSENAPVPILSKSQAPLAPPPTQSLPKLPPPRPASSGGKDSVRDRRLSGTNAKQLKIETQKLGPKVTEPATAGPKMQNQDLPPNHRPKTAGFIAQQRQALSAGIGRSGSILRGPSPVPPGLTAEGAPPTPPVPSSFQDSETIPGSAALSRPPTLRKNFSSSSLKTTKTRNPSISNIDEYSDVSPGTPLSNPFASATSSARLPTMPSLPTPVASAFRDRMASSSAAGGYNLFDADIHSPMVPGDQPVASESAPFPLEPCPKETLLRPFWLMRALYQTLCHPKGGYISNKLFVPRDAWRVKGVKIKNVEDKISQCDLLTAALQKLDMVNSDDADAVLEEMQSLENVLEQVQIFFTRRLGNDVGVQGSGALFKDADGALEGLDGKPIPRNNSVSGKGSAFSWKRLRNKTSSTTINSSFSSVNGNGNRKDSSADGLLNTVPFTDHPTSKPSKRDLQAVSFSGPNAHYMAALARLFDAAQAIDQIARQVEDPGLRHQDKTQVGLELSTRHAAEFFGFYICRFVLQDLTLLLDKFIKRGSEWVLV
ncbi:hypothetical protein N0V93_000340 [Gnomoniopsis smithogilvyi]|uniref:MIT domain-containing protein n=1 Tax=Gnomoniopsis smithogilvyi TaxID=1191159 RepID=A0A9W9D0M5_9PEZI|nr:hypothetical protein N0V93_000340 [Gnomoniopsis smithogilvyi]